MPRIDFVITVVTVAVAAGVFDDVPTGVALSAAVRDGVLVKAVDGDEVGDALALPDSEVKSVIVGVVLDEAVSVIGAVGVNVFTGVTVTTGDSDTREESVGVV